jgi:hypothetical protein
MMTKLAAEAAFPHGNHARQMRHNTVPASTAQSEGPYVSSNRLKRLNCPTESRTIRSSAKVRGDGASVCVEKSYRIELLTYWTPASSTPSVLILRTVLLPSTSYKV